MLKIKLYLAIITLFIITVSISFIITGCQITNLDERTSGPQIDRAYIYDRDHDGRIDAVDLKFNRNIDDSSFVLTKWLFNSSDPLTFATGFSTGANTNDRNVTLFYDTDDLTIDTTTASLSFLGGDTVKDLTGIKYTQYLPKIHDIRELDKASPIMKIAYYYDASWDPSKGGTPGVSRNDIVDIVFYDKIKAGVNFSNISNLLKVLVPTDGTFGDASTDYSIDNGNLRIRLGNGPKLEIKGTYGIDGSSSGVNFDDIIVTTNAITDYSGNDAAKRIPDGVDITETSIPALNTAVLRDRNNNGRIDAVELTFTEPIKDSTVVPGKWTFGLKKATGTGIDTGSYANDNILTILYATDDLTADTSVNTASIIFNDGDSIEDLFLHKLPEIENVSEKDGAGPAILSADATDDVNKVPGVIDTGDKVIIKFSERTNRPVVNKTNIDAILKLNNSHSWLDFSGNILSAVWSLTSINGVSVDVLTITLSTTSGVPTVAPGDTITIGYDPDGILIKDSSGNYVNAVYTITGSF